MANVKTKNKAAELMERYGANEIFENSRGEFFLEKSLALNSENGKEDKVKTIKKNKLWAVLKE